MYRFRHHRLKPLLLLSVAVLLRAAIPAGYMPAAAGSGLLFEFCPEGISTEFMQILSGDSGHDHSHGGDDGENDNHKCPVGHMLLSAAAVDNASEVILAPVALALTTNTSYSFTSVSRTHYQSRGPPA
jgi:hypothetical protein